MFFPFNVVTSRALPTAFAGRPAVSFTAPQATIHARWVRVEAPDCPPYLALRWETLAVATKDAREAA